ncbi:hypothetical protein J6590_065028 [Homalodisca vitripennis]|nr:hypothetical protein J6590_065028 [Homalodisca vitripennis]
MSRQGGCRPPPTIKIDIHHPPPPPVPVSQRPGTPLPLPNTLLHLSNQAQQLTTTHIYPPAGNNATRYVGQVKTPVPTELAPTLNGGYLCADDRVTVCARACVSVRNVDRNRMSEREKFTDEERSTMKRRRVQLVKRTAKVALHTESLIKVPV